MKSEAWVIEKLKAECGEVLTYNDIVRDLCPSNISLKDRPCNPNDCEQSGYCGDCWKEARDIKLINKKED